MFVDTLFPRHAELELEEALTGARVINLVGARQAGKTTLVRDLFSDGHFVTLDDHALAAAVEADPLGQVHALRAAAGNAPVIIDEVQRSPRLALSIKQIVDTDRRMGQFILTGSADIFTSAQALDSLAGRTMTITLYPFSWAELRWAKPAKLMDWAASTNPTLADLPRPEMIDRSDYIAQLVRGFYPGIQTLPPRVRQRRYRADMDAVVERDLGNYMKIKKVETIRRFVDILAARTAQELNLQELGSMQAVQRPTLDAWLDVLRRLSLVQRLPAWTPGETGRDISNAKYHFVDTGVVAALRGMTEATFAPTAQPSALGPLLETAVHGELAKNLPHQEASWRLYHWRTSRGYEIDVLAESPGALVGFEVKASSAVAIQDFKNLRWFSDNVVRDRRHFVGIVIYLGAHALSFGSNLFALPLSIFGSFK